MLFFLKMGYTLLNLYNQLGVDLCVKFRYYYNQNSFRDKLVNIRKNGMNSVVLVDYYEEIGIKFISINKISLNSSDKIYNNIAVVNENSNCPGESIVSYNNENGVVQGISNNSPTSTKASFSIILCVNNLSDNLNYFWRAYPSSAPVSDDLLRADISSAGFYFILPGYDFENNQYSNNYYKCFIPNRELDKLNDNWGIYSINENNSKLPDAKLILPICKNNKYSPNVILENILYYDQYMQFANRQPDKLKTMKDGYTNYMNYISKEPEPEPEPDSKPEPEPNSDFDIDNYDGKNIEDFLDNYEEPQDSNRMVLMFIIVVIIIIVIVIVIAAVIGSTKNNKSKSDNKTEDKTKDKNDKTKDKTEDKK